MKTNSEKNIEEPMHKMLSENSQQKKSVFVAYHLQ